MMDVATKNCLPRARSLTLAGARWLALIRFQTRPRAPMFLPGITIYHDMFDPAAMDAKRQAACLSMLPAIERQIEIERWKHEEAHAIARLADPHRLEWGTILRGAALETTADLLREASSLFRAAGLSRDS